MNIEFELPLDADGYLRRECPNCEHEFKWHHGQTENAPDGFVYENIYWCPRCGRSAAPDQWFTQAQIEHQEAVVAAAAPDAVADMLASAFKSSRNSGIAFTRNGTHNAPLPPDPLVEPDDMVIVAPPCHPWEPVKVPEDAAVPYHCLLCGARFAV